MSKKHTSDLIGQRNQRINKVEKLISLGIDPYPSKGVRSVDNEKITTDFNKYEGKKVTVLGRIMTWRKHGELQFMDIQDDSGRVQLYIKQSELSETDPKGQVIGPDHLDLLDIGDFVQAEGKVTKTKSGEPSVLISQIRILTKSIRPLPNKWTGIIDKESRFRRRYLDMTMSPEVRERFKRRAQYWQFVRDHMNEAGFYEVNIPVLEHTTGGADARPFVTHYDALGEDFYLRISHELPLKRLLGAGFEKVYDVGPRFRNEGFSDEHLPEHIAMEWYWAFADYRDGMKFTEGLFKEPLRKVYGKLQFDIKGMSVNLDTDWEEMDFSSVIKERFDVDIFDDDLETLANALVKNSDFTKDDLILNRSRLADGLWKLIRPTVVGPVFLTGVPKFLSPLSKANTEDPRKTDRYHAIIAGSELCNAFSELNDPQDQLERFVEQQKMRESGDDEAHMLDIDFVEMLEYGMPPAVGYGMSERVFWVFENVSAREGVPFPPLRRDTDPTTKEIYGDILKEDKILSESTTKKGKKYTEESKIVMVLNKELEGWKVTNTVGHISAFLGNKAGNSLRGRESFIYEDGEFQSNAQFPIVALSGTDTQLHNLVNKMNSDEDQTIEFFVYTEEMVEFLTDDEVQAALEEKKLNDIVIYGVGLLGDKKEVDKITIKFSLWK